MNTSTSNSSTMLWKSTSSPKSVAEESPLLHDPLFVKENINIDSSHHQAESCTLEELISKLPNAIAAQKSRGIQPGSADDEVFDLMSRVQLEYQDMARYAHSDPSRNYTRNLISTDDESYTLLLLCWNPHKSSPIHDHPCDGCWMKVLQGNVFECRYREHHEGEENPNDHGNNNSSDNTPPCFLECTQKETYHHGQVAFINDSMGYHKVGNESAGVAMTLHLYAPPFQKCRTWLDPQHANKASQSKMCFYSAYGHKL